jgi:TonB-linked SusC/RagA family outer membrane protein
MKRLFSFNLFLLLLLFSSQLFGQETITGTVIDDRTGEPLIYANIMAVGTEVGAFTDLDGKFTLEMPEGVNEIIVSYTGYADQTIDISGKAIVDVRMSSSQILDDVLVIGYTTQKKSDKTGAVSHVDAKELNQGRLSDPIQALQGKAAGVNISKQGGDPNAGFSVNIRGASSLTAGTGPLFIVDGVQGVDPTTLNPDDIESYNVLKDAASTAIFGARGSNGVIIITTKGSTLGRTAVPTTSVEYSGFVSFDEVARRLDFLDGDQMRQFAEETGRTFQDNGANTDWQDEIYRTGFSHLQTLAFSGNSESGGYRASVSANQIQGVLKGSSKDRYIGRLNLTQKAFDGRLTMSARLSGTIENNDFVTYGGGIDPKNVIYQAFRRSPTDPVLDENGEFFETDRSFQYFNPAAIINDIENERVAKRLLGNFRLDLEILKGLTGSVNLGYIRNDDESFYFEPSFTPSNQTQGFGRRSYTNYENRLIETTLSYVKDLKGGHFLNLIGGHSYQVEVFDGFAAQGKNAQSDLVTSNNLGTLLLLEPGSISSYKGENLLASIFASAIYDFDKKYFAKVTFRRDGSSKFGKNNEWGVFPSISLGWDIMREPFMPDNLPLNQLKLRASYGITGNQNIPSNVDAVLFRNAGTAINPETGETVFSFEREGDLNNNPDLKWEENQELNLGLDFGFFDNRVSGSIEYYRKKTVDLIYPYFVPKPPNIGTRTYANVGEIENNGIEVTLQSFVVSQENLSWKTIATFSSNTQKTVSLSNDEYQLEELQTLFVSGRGLVGGNNSSQIIRPGLEIGTFYLPQYAGLSDDGKFLFFTEAGGVTRNVEQAERRVVGSAQPDFILGWSNFFNIGKRWDASFALRAVVGHDILNVTRMVFSNPADLPTLNTLEEALDEYDRGLSSSPVLSDYYLEDGSFLKLDNVVIGYTIDNFNSKYIQNLRFYVSGTNLLVLTGYSGLDPELSFGGTEFGRDQYDVYPKTRSVTFGLNATF